MTPYHRYVAIGDSQTEGVGDGDDRVGLRGWADRLAERLAAANPGLEYANLAVRGRMFDFNARIRAAAARHGVLAVETDGIPFSTDPRSWGPDRLHLSPLGHRLAAAAVAHALGLPDVDPA